MLVTDSGFEDAIFQSGICTSGSLLGVLSGLHYNRGWSIHNAFSEALKRLLLKRFLYEEGIVIPGVLNDLDDLDEINVMSLTNDTPIAFANKYQNYRERLRQGASGKTAQFNCEF